MEKNKKIEWLQKHYKPYSTKWYSEDEVRLNAIFNKEYQKYLNAIVKHTNDVQKAKINTLADRLRQAYKEHFHSDYDSDFSLDRHSTHERAMSIRAFWASEPSVA